MRDWIGRTPVIWRAMLGAVLLVLAGGAWAQRLSLESLQLQINAKIALSDLLGCAANDAVVRVAGVWKCKSTLPRFVDNGDGTVTDNKTGLMWEKKVTCGAQNLANPHCMENFYQWSADPLPRTDPTGTLYTSFLSALNDLDTPNDGNATPCFANYCDWRIPTIGELRSILSAAFPNCVSSPCIDAVLGPTMANLYWSASPTSPTAVWVVFFNNGQLFGFAGKNGFGGARAVRGSGS